MAGSARTPPRWSTDPVPATLETWLNVKLEEYRALRAEVMTSIAAQQSVLSFGVATVALVFGPGLGLLDKATGLSVSVIFSTLVPLLCAIVLIVWWGENMRMVRAGEWLAHVEDEINSVGRKDLGWPHDALAWESWLREEPLSLPYHWVVPPPYDRFPFVRQFVVNVRGVLLAFWTIALASLGLGVFYDLETHERLRPETIGLTLASLAVLAGSAAFMRMRWRRERVMSDQRLTAHLSGDRL